MFTGNFVIATTDVLCLNMYIQYIGLEWNYLSGKFRDNGMD